MIHCCSLLAVIFLTFFSVSDLLSCQAFPPDEEIFHSDDNDIFFYNKIISNTNVSLVKNELFQSFKCTFRFH